MDQAIIQPAIDTSNVVELRQYTLHPGKRDELMTLFEHHFVAGQQALGIHLHGEFHDTGNPDRFVWLRGYNDMAERPRELEAFYQGPVWKAHREQANATMIDSDNVLLLQPADGQGFTLARKMAATMVATIYLLQSSVDASFLRFFQERIRPVMVATGARSVAELKSLEAANNFPALPVREGEHAFVWFAAYGSDDELRRHIEATNNSPEAQAMERELQGKLKSPVQHLVLHPTQRALDRSREPYRYSLDLKGDVHDFDFVDGEWNVINHRLAQRGVGSMDWETFPATSWAKVLLGGVTNVDEIKFPTKGWSGMTVRHFELARRQWNICWVNSRDGKMDFPGQLGGFDGDVGLFYGTDTDEGKPVKVVYRWERQGTKNARWEQAFSYDEGKTWETNWVIELKKK